MQGITKSFPGVRALKAVNFAVGAGEVVALIGENGAGKSTLMKILGGVYQPDAGEIRINGEAVGIRGVADANRFGIGFIHQELNVLDNLDVAGNVFLGREPLRGGVLKPLRLIDRGRMRVETARELEQLGVSFGPDTPLASLSIAERQMVEIAKALSLHARLLIMDEPTSSLTLSETARLLAVVRGLKAQGVSVIYISHRLGEIAEIADRVVGLRDGANAGELARDEITHDRMVQLMVGRELSHEYVPPAAPPAPGFFRVEGVRTRRYPQHAASFEIGKGEILGLAGLVGAGRSELAAAVFGVEPPVGGSLVMNGETITINSPQDAIRRGIYLIPEDRRLSGLIVESPIRENITLPALERYSSIGLVAPDRERRAASVVSAQLGVKAASIEVKAANLSGGNQQKVVLAKWLSLEPKVLIFDEPTRGIDVGAKAEIYALMRSLAASGVAILMISSDMEEVLGVSDRVAVMREGAVTGILSRDECSEEAVMRLAVGEKA
jgi:ribose transport system ATP-binding protein